MNFQQTWSSKKTNHTPMNSSSNWQAKNKKGNLLARFVFNKTFLKIVAVIFLLGAVLLFAAFAWFSRDLPNPNQLMDRQVAQSTKIYDRTGTVLLYEIHGDQARTLVQLADIPNNVKWATIAVEDKNFYDEKSGFSVQAILRTAFTDIIFHRKAGGSTLTQQFIKNAVLTNEKTLTRKIKEIILAYRLEQKFSKDQILQMYLNEIPYGSTAYGVEAASQRYFKKDVKNVDLAEAAILAALPQSPTVYSPYGSHKDLLVARQHYILDLMAQQGYITADEAAAAKAEQIKFAPDAENITAPHFVMYVKELLTEKYGELMVEQGGLKITTTLDVNDQKLAEQAIDDWWNKTKVVDKKTGQENPYNSFGASNAALVSIDPKTGQVLAMVGSRDYFNEAIDGQVNIATSLRQPGSSLKPVVYSALFLKGYTPNTILHDVSTNFSSDPKNPYQPQDFTGKELGPVTIRAALQGSLNIPAVKATYLAGLDNIVNLAKTFGYTSLNDESRFGLSLALGGAEVELLEHTNAYGIFSQEGAYHPVASILKVEDKDGKVLEQWQPSSQNVLDQNVAREITDILSDNNARAYMFGLHSNLQLGDRPVAAKTGTTNDYHDAWQMGYTPSIATGVWVGNSDNKAMNKSSEAVNAAGPIWHEYMAAVLANTPIEQFNKPDIPVTGKPILDGTIPGQTVKIDKVTGLLATDLTPPEMIIEKTYRQNHCILYYVNKDDPTGPAPADPTQDPQFAEWEKDVQAWAAKTATSSALSAATGTPPTAYDNVHTAENKPMVKINSPANNAIINGSFLTTDVQASAPRGINSVSYYINGNLFATKSGGFFNLNNQSLSFLANGYHNLKVTACDDVDNCSSDSVEINLVGGNENISPEFAASLTWPSSGLALGEGELPAAIKFQVTNLGQIGRIDIYARDASGTESLLGTINSINSSEPSFAWPGPDQSGTYALFGKAYSWEGNLVKTNEASVTITKAADRP
ncbi:MAG TPA: transglycosylase domain-containing protein [Candidatus Nanoarchaeia archaeon]|nr:transglycosylase domain-containing protein [Candidatus Nanoarchaeia archaeon]